MDNNVPNITIVSGGTATNELVSLFSALTPRVTYVLPISDNGGSTSELIRVIGGPAIGDIRSRLTRLIPQHQDAYRQLFSYRLSDDPEDAKRQWNQIVEGSHPLWAPIEPASREIFRSFLVHVHVELLKRSRHQFMQHPNKKQFRYELANVGNLFLTGIRLFIGSLDSAIELFSRLTEIDPSIKVLPCVNTNFTYHISALLQNGLIITGQSQISHPSTADHSNYPPPIHVSRPPTPIDECSPEYFQTSHVQPHIPEPISDVSSDEEESGNVPQYTHPELKKSQLHFDKSENITPLLSPIERIFYISPYGEEICPTAPNRVTSNMTSADAIIYSIGSLMTSIVPVLILKGVGRAIAAAKNKKKILLLNGSHDRETFGMSATDFVETIVKSATYSLNEKNPQSPEWTTFVTHLIYLTDSDIVVDVETLNKKGIVCVAVERQEGTQYYDTHDLQEKLSALLK